MKLSLIAAAFASAFALCECSNKMVIGYFPNWLYASYPVEKIPYKKYTHLNYAFAIMNTPDLLPTFTDDWAVQAYLPKIIDLAHQSKTKVLLSIGGWTGSKKFSTMVASAEARKKFVDWNIKFMEDYHTDGVDLDWEYPGKQAAGCNEVSDRDADNYLLLLKDLRNALDASFPNDFKEISMAVHVQPFVKSGSPMTNVKEFVPYFNHINLMAYDMNGAWAPITGPNAPFDATPNLGAPFSFVDSIRDWKAAGVPSDKITAGLAFYGRAIKAKVDMSKQNNQFQLSEVGAPKGDSDDAYWTDPFCDKEDGGLSGVWKWTNLRSEGLIKDDFVSTGNGWQRYWDDVSQTPWLFNPASNNFISYDDPQSLDIKVNHALCENLAGVMIWDIHQDNGELIDAVNRIHVNTPSCGVSNPSQKPIIASTVKANPSKATEDANHSKAAPSKDIPSKDTPPLKDIPSNDVPDNDDDEEYDYGESEDPEDIEGRLPPSPQPVTSTPSSTHSSTLTHYIPEFPPIVFMPGPVIPAPTVSLPVPISTSAKPTTSTKAYTTPPSSDTDLALLDGTPCSYSGEQKCVKSNQSPKWLTCNIDHWIVRECPSTLVCKDGFDGSLYCDFPSPSLKAASIDTQQALHPLSTTTTTSKTV